MQGEGREFESPRLHQDRERASVPGRRSKFERGRSPDPTEEHNDSQWKRPGSRPGADPRVPDRTSTTARRLVLEPSLRVRELSPDRCAQPDASPPTSGELGRAPAMPGAGSVPVSRHSTLPNWIVVTGNRSELRFRRGSKETHPAAVDPCLASPGQLREAVKLLRARGGCLGAKSR